MTVLTLDATGTIVEADVAVNVADRGYTTTSECEDGGLGYDLVAVLTHEFGHVFGLEHSADPTASMFEVTQAGQCRQRTLSDEDIDGLCGAYKRGEVGNESCPEESSGCAASADGAEGLGGTLLLVVWLLRGLVFSPRRALPGAAGAPPLRFVIGNVIR